MTASAIGEKQILIVIVKVINNNRRRLIPPSNFKTTAPHRHLLIIINDFLLLLLLGWVCGWRFSVAGSKNIASGPGGHTIQRSLIHIFPLDEDKPTRGGYFLL